MRYLFILKQSPYHSSLAREALDFALASAAFDQQVSLLFMGDGLFQLIKNQQSVNGKKNIEKTLNSLSLFEIENIYYSDSCAQMRGLQYDQFSIKTKQATHQDIQTLLNSSDRVFNF